MGAQLPVAEVVGIGHVHGVSRKGGKPQPCNCGTSHIVILCPYCGHLHTHGGNESQLGSHRIAHCWKDEALKVNSDGYLLGEKP